MGWFAAPGVKETIMAWGTLFTDTDFLNAVLGGTGGDPLLSAGIQLLSAGKSGTEYASALKQSKQLLNLEAQTARDRAAAESTSRNLIMSRSAELGGALRQAYTAMGPQTPINEGQIAADYGALKATGMADLNDLIELTSSQGYAGGLAQRGGAESQAIEGARQTALVKQFAPQVSAVSNTAWDQAIARATGRQNLMNQSRQNIYGEISGVVQPEISGYTATLNPAATTAAITGSAQSAASREKNVASERENSNTALASALSRLFTRNNDIIWNT